MTALSLFTDFMNMTPPVYVTGPRQMINDAIDQAPLIGRLLLGQDFRQVIQGGQTIRDTIKINVTGTSQTYSPGQPYGGYTKRQSSSLQETRFRYFRDSMSWTEAEMMQNMVAGLSDNARAQVFKQLQYSKEQDLWTSIFNGLEALLFADPGSAAAESAQEGAEGTEPFALYTLVNEETNRIPLNWAANVVQNLDRVVLGTGAQNSLVQYDFAQPDDQDADGDGLLDAFESTRLALNFRPPRLPGTEQFFQPSRPGNDPNKQFIAASNDGVGFYTRRLLERNDTLASPQDPAFIAPKYGGVELFQVSTLATASLYPGTSGTVTAAEEGATVDNTGHRYFWLDANFLYPVFHASKFFDKQPAFKLQEAPDTMVQIVDVWYNIWLGSPKRQGIVSPGG